MLNALPLSRASTEARRSAFFSKRSASLTSSFPRFSGVSFRHGPLKALRAAATAMSTSFSVASATLQMTSSVDGLMTSKVLPSTAFTNSLLMKLIDVSIEDTEALQSPRRISETGYLTYSPVGCSYSPVWGVVSFTDVIAKANWGIWTKQSCEVKEG